MVLLALWPSLQTTVLRNHLHPHNWAGVFMNAGAVICVSASALFDPSSGSNVPLGIACILFGCFVMATQLVIEEKVMSGDNTPPLVVVGMEGFWGTVIMLCVIYPIAYMLPGNDHVRGQFTSLSSLCF